jgi:hypothetical protein
MNQRYHQYVAWWWGFADKLSKMLVAAVATLALVATYWSEHFKSSEIVIAAIAAALAIVLNVLPFGEREKFYDELFRSWSDLRTDAEVFDLKIEAGPEDAEHHICERVAEFKTKEHLLHAKEPAPIVTLLKRCEGDEIQRRWGGDIRTFEQAEQERARRLAVSPVVALEAGAAVAGRE